jgi:hypothetical protein
MQLYFICFLLKEEKKIKEKKSVWRQVCEYLSEAAAHLPALAGGLLIADIRNELNTHLAL